jgi:hypothetical protein
LEASVSICLVELLDVPVRQASYWISDGLVFEYEVVPDRSVELGNL